MTDLEYVVRCCNEHAEREAHDADYWRRASVDRLARLDKLTARCDALNKLCTARKPRSKTAKRDIELIELFKQYPI